MVVQRDGSQHGYIDPVFVAIFNHGGQFGVQGMDAFYHQDGVFLHLQFLPFENAAACFKIEARHFDLFA